MNALLLAVVDQRVVRKKRVALNLEGCGHDASRLDDAIQLIIVFLRQLSACKVDVK